MDSLNVRLKINAESMDITDEMGNTFKYVNPMEKTISICEYYIVLNTSVKNILLLEANCTSVYHTI